MLLASRQRERPEKQRQRPEKLRRRPEMFDSAPQYCSRTETLPSIAC